jgi:hypothetical protein
MYKVLEKCGINKQTNKKKTSQALGKNSSSLCRQPLKFQVKMEERVINK